MGSYSDWADGGAASRQDARIRAGDKGGWIRRAEVVLSTKYHMDRKAFVRRVARWQEEKR